MAAAEARAAWQRTANRCFVQEDAKRAPKLACCPSTSSTSKQVDAGPANATNGDDNISVGFVPLNKNSSYSNLPPESRWWLQLQLQPNYGYQKALTNEQLKTMETEMETRGTDVQNSTSKASEVYLQNEDNGMHMEDCLNDQPCAETYLRNSAIFIKKDPEVRKQELKTVYCKNSQEPLKQHNLGESCELLEMDPGGCTVSKQANELSFDLDSNWIGSEKTVPWWRMADRDELASLVAQRSLDLIENCDLPCPQKVDVKMDPYAYPGYFGSDGLLPSDDFKAQTGGFPSPILNAQGNLALKSECRMQSAPSEEQLQCGSDMLNSDCLSHNVTTETQISESDPGRAQLLEALCHSQTRAREAEKAVKQAYVEKEHILKLFLRQASHLFAYKQWFRLLQLENLYIQIKNNNQPISGLFPLVRPWIPHKARKQQRSWRKPAIRGKRGKRSRPNRDASKFTVAFALGLTLVGAGLLLGWTVGWMLPTF